MATTSPAGENLMADTTEPLSNASSQPTATARSFGSTAISDSDKSAAESPTSTTDKPSSQLAESIQ